MTSATTEDYVEFEDGSLAEELDKEIKSPTEDYATWVLRVTGYEPSDQDEFYRHANILGRLRSKYQNSADYQMDKDQREAGRIEEEEEKAKQRAEKRELAAKREQERLDRMRAARNGEGPRRGRPPKAEAASGTPSRPLRPVPAEQESATEDAKPAKRGPGRPAKSAASESAPAPRGRGRKASASASSNEEDPF